MQVTKACNIPSFSRKTGSASGGSCIGKKVSLKVILLSDTELELVYHDLKLRFVVRKELCIHNDRTAAVATKTASARTRRELKLEVYDRLNRDEMETAVTHESLRGIVQHSDS